MTKQLIAYILRLGYFLSIYKWVSMITLCRWRYSGLFMTYKLSQTGKDIILIESTSRLGGRLLTKQEKGVQFELGGARTSSNIVK